MKQEQVIKCIQGFFQEGRVKTVIETIEKCNISGWEGWLQVEFAHYLETKVYGEKKQEFNWYREYKIITKSPNKDRCDEQNKYIIPDFWISSDKAPNAYFLIEFKRSNTGGVVSEMKVDVEKWLKHIDAYEDRLECLSETEKPYNNLGVFFVGIDTKSTNLSKSIEGVEPVFCDKSLKYRIDFLSLETINRQA